MSVLRKQWSLHTAQGSIPLLDGSRWGFDRSWAPQGAGTAVLPMDDPLTASIIANDRQPLRIVCDLWHTVPGGTLGDGVMPGTRLGDAAWPLETVSTYPDTMVDAGGAPTVHKRAAWHCWPRAISRDHVARTVTVQIATVELLLVEAVNGGDPWIPAPTGPNGSHRLSDVLLELSRYLRIPLVVEKSTATVDMQLVQPWGRGESAWDWFEGLRAAAAMSYRYDATLNRIRFVALTDQALGTVVDDYLNRSDDIGGAGVQEGLGYADALLVTWRWTDTEGVEREFEQLALAPGVASWRHARKTRRLELRSRVQAGIAAHIVKQLSRWRSRSTLVAPLDEHTLVDLGTGRGATAQAIQYAIDDAPTVTFTIIEE